MSTQSLRMLRISMPDVACMFVNIKLLRVVTIQNPKDHSSAPYTTEHARNSDHHAADVVAEQGRV